MSELVRIGPWSMGKIQAILGALFGLIIGFFMALFMIVIGLISREPAMAFVGIGYFIGMPIVYLISGFILGPLLAWLYNVVAGWVGGLELEFEE